MSFESDTTGMGINQSGKSGGDASGSAYSHTGAMGGSSMGHGSGNASGGWGTFAEGIGVGMGGDAGAAGMAGQIGGDVTDNTSIGSINISS